MKKLFIDTAHKLAAKDESNVLVFIVVTMVGIVAVVAVALGG